MLRGTPAEHHPDMTADEFLALVKHHERPSESLAREFVTLYLQARFAKGSLGMKKKPAIILIERAERAKEN